MMPNSYFTSVFVSLGVFVFGYDQGVMSGIITYVQATTLSHMQQGCLHVDNAAVLISRTTSISPPAPKLAQWLPFWK